MRARDKPVERGGTVLSSPKDDFAEHGDSANQYSEILRSIDQTKAAIDERFVGYPEEWLDINAMPGTGIRFRTKLRYYFYYHSSPSKGKVMKCRYPNSLLPLGKGETWFVKSIFRDWSVIIGEVYDRAGNKCNIGKASRIITFFTLVFCITFHAVAMGTQVVANKLAMRMKKSGVLFKVFVAPFTFVFGAISIGLHFVGDIIRSPAAIAQRVQMNNNYPTKSQEEVAKMFQDITLCRSNFVAKRDKYMRDAKTSKLSAQTFAKYQAKLMKKAEEIEYLQQVMQTDMRSIDTTTTIKVLERTASNRMRLYSSSSQEEEVAIDSGDEGEHR